MRPNMNALIASAFATLICLPLTDIALAQSRSGGCSIQQVGSTSRNALRCRGGLTAIIERGARYTLLDRTRDGNADTVRLDAGAILFEVEQSDTPIEVIAPQAIAAVRGTKWAVDVQASRTSVFVVNGSVAVRRRTGRESVVLNAGDGVDVEAGRGPLEVKRWSRSRASALLARFGQ